MLSVIGRPVANLAVAHIAGVFGIRGELKCRPTSVGTEAIESGRRCFFDAEGKRPVTIRGTRRHLQQLLVAFEGVSTVEAAQAFVGATLYLPREEIPLGANEFFDDELIGIRVLDPAGTELGVVVAIEHYPAQDCLVLEPGRILIPLVRAFVVAIDVAQRSITMDLPRGLIDTLEAEEA
jgi:16S rRNA processing protein RimM